MVTVGASIGEFAKKMQQVVKKVEETAKKVRESTEAVAKVGAIFAAGIAAAAKASAVTNEKMAAGLERLSRLVYTLAAELGDLFAPYVQKVGDAVARFVAFIQRLDPETKRAAARFVVFAAAGGLLAAKVSAAAGLVEGLAKAAGAVLVPALSAAADGYKRLGKALESMPTTTKDFRETFAKLGPQILAAAGPVLAVVAAVASLAVLSAVVYHYWGQLKSIGSEWNKDFSSAADAVSKTMGEVAASVGETVANVAATLADVFRNIFAGLKDFTISIMEAGVSVIVEKVKALAKYAETAARLTLGDKDPLVKRLAQIQNLSTEAVTAGMRKGLESVYAEGEKALAERVEQAQQSAKAFAEKVAPVARQVSETGANTVLKGSGAVGFLAANALGKDDTLKVGAQGVKESLAHASADISAALGPVIESVMGGLTGTLDAWNTSRAEDVRMRATAEDLEDVKKGIEATVEALDIPGAFKAVKDHTDKLNEGFAKAAEAIHEHAAALAKAVKDAQRDLADRLKSSLGRLSDLFDTFAQGALAGGSPLAGVAAVAVQLVTESEGFRVVIEMVGTMVQRVADALGGFMVHLEPLVGALSHIVDGALATLAPLWALIGQLLEPIAPVLVMVGDMLHALAPVLGFVAAGFGLLKLAFTVMEPAMKALFEVMKVVASIIGGIVLALMEVWNGLVGAVQGLLRQLAKLPFLEGLADWADGLNAVLAPVDELNSALAELNARTWESADAKAREAAEALKNRQALSDVTEQLTNVPAGFRVARKRFLASQGQPLELPTAGVPAPAMPPSGPSAPAPAPAQGGNVTIINNIETWDTEEAFRKLREQQERDTYRLRGGRHLGNRWAREG